MEESSIIEIVKSKKQKQKFFIEDRAKYVTDYRKANEIEPIGHEKYCKSHHLPLSYVTLKDWCSNPYTHVFIECLSRCEVDRDASQFVRKWSKRYKFSSKMYLNDALKSLLPPEPSSPVTSPNRQSSPYQARKPQTLSSSSTQPLIYDNDSAIKALATTSSATFESLTHATNSITSYSNEIPPPHHTTDLITQTLQTSSAALYAPLYAPSAQEQHVHTSPVYTTSAPVVYSYQVASHSEYNPGEDDETTIAFNTHTDTVPYHPDQGVSHPDLGAPNITDHTRHGSGEFEDDLRVLKKLKKTVLNSKHTEPGEGSTDSV